jgi:hypothetical protein
MFISIKLLQDKVDYEAGMVSLSYLLEDDDFVMRMVVEVEREIYEERDEASIIPSGLISIYSQWGKNVSKNLALFYTKSFPPDLPFNNQKSCIEIDKNWTDLYFPYCNYGEKYYRCVLNQLKILKYTGRATYAQLITRTVLQENQ